LVDRRLHEPVIHRTLFAAFLVAPATLVLIVIGRRAARARLRLRP
jgi:hypothetical protein